MTGAELNNLVPGATFRKDGKTRVVIKAEYEDWPNCYYVTYREGSHVRTCRHDRFFKWAGKKWRRWRKDAKT